MATLIPNPWGATRVPRPLLKGAEDLAFLSTGPTRGWSSKHAADNGEIAQRSNKQQGAGPHRIAQTVQYGSHSYCRSCKVVCDDACVEVARAFDLDLDWQQQLYAI